MKKGWMIVLLVSVGLNVGLGARMMGSCPRELAVERKGAGPAERGSPRWERPAPGDTIAWRQFMGRRIEHLTARLDLRPEQVAGFQATQGLTGQRMREIRQQLWRTRAALQELMAAEIIDRPAIRLVTAKMAQKQAQMDSLASETLLGELELLDEGQRSRYLDFHPASAGMHQGAGRRGRGMRGK